MRRRNRKLIGAIVMVSFVVVYALLLMAMAQSAPLQQAHPIIQGVFYVIGGLGWVLPIMPLIRWMEGGGD
jgi:hypothetical protein